MISPITLITFVTGLLQIGHDLHDLHDLKNTNLTHSFLTLVNRVNPVHFFFPRSLVDVSDLNLQVCKPFQRRQARHEEALTAAKRVEGFDAVDAASHRLLRNGERCSLFLQPDNGITLVTGADEIAVIDPT